MGQLVSYFATFSLGLLSGYLLMRLQDRLQSRKALARDVYRPLHEDLFRAHLQSKRGDRFLEYSNWQKIRATGLTLTVPDKLRTKLEKLFEITLRSYDSAWGAGRDWLYSILRGWDEKFGAPPPSGGAVRAWDWWGIYVQDEFQAPVPDLGANEIIPLGQTYIGSYQLRNLRLTLEEICKAEVAGSVRGSGASAFPTMPPCSSARSFRGLGPGESRDSEDSDIKPARKVPVAIVVSSQL